jgi:hypothetical protein
VFPERFTVRQATILTPGDVTSSRNGILPEGIPNQESMIIAALNLETIQGSRTGGTVPPLHDSRTTAAVVSLLEEVFVRHAPASASPCATPGPRASRPSSA